MLGDTGHLRENSVLMFLVMRRLTWALRTLETLLHRKQLCQLKVAHSLQSQCSAQHPRVIHLQRNRQHEHDKSNVANDLEGFLRRAAPSAASEAKPGSRIPDTGECASTRPGISGPYCTRLPAIHTSGFDTTD